MKFIASHFRHVPAPVTRGAVAFISALGIILAVSTFAAGETTVAKVEGESMRWTTRTSALSTLSDAGLSGGKAANMLWSGTIAGQYTGGGVDRISVRAKGSYCRGNARMAVTVDQKKVLERTVSSSWQSYSTDVQVPAGTHTVGVTFLNDYYRRNCDRNLHVDVVTMYGSGSVPVASPTPSTKPSPTPVATASPVPPGQLLFDGSSLSKFSLLQAAPGAITEVSDPLGSGSKSFKFTVDNDDVYPVTPTKDPRAQALSPSFIKPGNEFWLKTKMLFPSNFPTVSSWMSLVSVYGPPFNGPSPWTIGASGNELQWGRNSTYGWDVPWRMSLPKGRWITVLLHQRFGSDGWVEMWIDGKRVTFFQSGTYNPSRYPQTDRLMMKTMDSSNNGGSNHAKIMQYRQVNMFDTATMYFGPLQVGTSRAAVGG